MKAKKNTRQRSEQMQQVSAGLRDALGMTERRKEHPKATWAEIEAVVDERMNQLRAQLIQDVVQMGKSEDWSEIPQEERPRCATCGKPVLARGKQTRWVQTNAGQAVELKCNISLHIVSPSSVCAKGLPPHWDQEVQMTTPRRRNEMRSSGR